MGEAADGGGVRVELGGQGIQLAQHAWVLQALQQRCHEHAGRWVPLLRVSVP
jgi:hypothetical protein